MINTENFESLGLSEQMLKAVKAKGFEAPTAVQVLTIPRLLNETHDIVAQSQTGTGKTAAYGLPILQKLESSRDGVQAIILVPTRELAIQAAEELISYNQEKRLSITAIYGGAAISEQLRRLSRGVDIVVGTPGRVLDHIRRGTLKLDKIRYLVLDEADEMLNMGFVEDVEEIMSHTNEERQVLLFSATMPNHILRLSKTYMKNTEVLRVEAKQITTDLTEQIYFEVRESDKFDALTRIIDVESDFYGIIFVRTKVGVDEIVTRLVEHGYSAEALHGDVSQVQREKILKKFKSKAVNILIATDVAARGIDVENLTHVINYSLPQDSESYVHRIGRTGRAGNHGTAITFISSSEFRKFNFLMRDIKVDIKKEQLPSPQDIVAMKRTKIKDDMKEIIDTETYGDYADIAHELSESYGAEVALSALLRLAFRSELDQSNYPEIRSFSVDRKGTARIFIAIGKRDGHTAASIVEMIKSKADLNDKNIDDVRLFDNYSFVSVPYASAEVVVRNLNSENSGPRPIAEIAQPEGSRKSRDSRGDGDRGGSRRDSRGGGYERREGSSGRDSRGGGGGYGSSSRDSRGGGYERREDSSGRDSRGGGGGYGSSSRDSRGGGYERRDGSASRSRSTSSAPRRFNEGSSREHTPVVSNEGLDWNSFMKFDDGNSWGRGADRKTTKSVRQTPREATSAASRIEDKKRKE